MSAPPPRAEVAAIAPFAVDRDSAAPVYRQIADHLGRLLAAGDLAAGARLPAEEVLAARFGVNRLTLRRAIRELIAQGAVTQVHGRGTFVNQRRVIEQPLASSLISFSEAMKALDIPYTTSMLSTGVVRPGAALARRLGTEDEVYAIRRVRSVDELPVILIDNYLPRALFAGLLDRDLAGRQLFSVLAEDYATAPHDGVRTFEAQIAHQEIAQLLRIGIGDPVMYAEQTTRRADGTPIEASDMWIPGRRFKLHAHIFRTDGVPPDGFTTGGVPDDAAGHRGR